MKLCTVAVLLILSLGTIRHAGADVIYEYSGTLPTTGLTGSHSGIAAGENWIVRVGIDTSVEDGHDDAEIGIYANAVISAQVSFENGYSRTFSFGNPALDIRDVVVHDDFFVSGTTYRDMVSTDVRDGTVFGLLRVNALSFDTKPVPALSSDALPLPSTTFTAAPDPVLNIAAEPVFLFSDSFGSVSYNTEAANNVTLVVVPEPSSIALWSLIGLFALLRCRRSRA